MTTTETQRATIAALNDRLRKTSAGGKILLTAGIGALPAFIMADIMTAVRDFDAFNECNDPYGEHDFATLTVHGRKVLFKIDYYDRDCASAAPWDASKTRRVLTIQLTNEY